LRRRRLTKNRGPFAYALFRQSSACAPSRAESQLYSPGRKTSPSRKIPRGEGKDNAIPGGLKSWPDERRSPFLPESTSDAEKTFTSKKGETG
jgi:hypothetical protein